MGFTLERKDSPENKSAFPNEIVTDNISDSIVTKNIFIYNVANLDHTLNRPPNFPRLFYKACPDDQEYVLVDTMSDPFMQFIYDVDNKRYVQYVDGIREVCRLMCPMSPGDKSNVKNEKDVIKIQDFVLNNENYSRDNLNELGIFWSFNNPPKREEVDAAVVRMEKTYRNELARMSRVEMDNPKDVSYAANYISKRAADHFGESPSWHNTRFAKAAKKAAVPELTYKTCDDCGFNDIPEAAKKCWHCSYIFQAVEPVEPVEPVEVVKKAGRPKTTA